MIKQLVKVANRLDEIGLTKEADLLDKIIYKISQDNFKINTISKIALVMSDPKNPAKTVDITDQAILTAMSSVNNKVPPEFASWLTNGVGGKHPSAFFATSLWDNFGLNYIEKLPTGGAALKFYLSLVKDLSDYPDNNTESRGGKIRYNITQRYAGARSRASEDKMGKATTDFVANTLPEIDTGNEILNQTISKTTVENWNSLSAVQRAGVTDIATFLSVFPIIGTGASTFLLGTHIYEGKWSLVPMDLVGILLSFLLVGKVASYMASAALRVGVRSRSLLTNPQIYAAVYDMAWLKFSTKVEELATDVRTQLANTTWKAQFLTSLEGLKTNKALFEQQAKPIIEAEMKKQA